MCPDPYYSAIKKNVFIAKKRVFASAKLLRLIWNQAFGGGAVVQKRYYSVLRCYGDSVTVTVHLFILRSCRYLELMAK